MIPSLMHVTVLMTLTSYWGLATETIFTWHTCRAGTRLANSGSTSSLGRERSSWRQETRRSSLYCFIRTSTLISRGKRGKEWIYTVYSTLRSSDGKSEWRHKCEGCIAYFSCELLEEEIAGELVSHCISLHATQGPLSSLNTLQQNDG